MFTFTKDELEQFLLSVITSFAGEDGVYDFSRVEDNTRQMVVNRAIAALEASKPQRDTRLENSLPAIDENDWQADEEMKALEGDPTELDADDLPYPGFSLEIDDLEWQDNIPFDGQPIPYESDDDSPAELGLLPVA